MNEKEYEEFKKKHFKKITQKMPQILERNVEERIQEILKDCDINPNYKNGGNLEIIDKVNKRTLSVIKDGPYEFYDGLYGIHRARFYGYVCFTKYNDAMYAKDYSNYLSVFKTNGISKFYKGWLQLFNIGKRYYRLDFSREVHFSEFEYNGSDPLTIICKLPNWNYKIYLKEDLEALDAK